jgi:hypothetical protein
MELTRLIRVAALTAATVTASATFTLAQGVPAEIPPASYSGDQYVDSRGCIFVRAGVGGTTEWIPRVGRDRRQLCGYRPTLGGQTGTRTATAPSAAGQPGVTVIGGGAEASATAAQTTTGTTATTTARTAATASRPAATATRPAAPQTRTVATTPRSVATQPRSVATTPRPMPDPVEAPAATGPCANLPADVRPYFTGSGVRCGPQAVHPGDAARGAGQTSAVDDAAAPEVRQVVRYAVNPPEGYVAAWDDGRMNPYRGLGTASGYRQMEQVWTSTAPRRLEGTAPRGYRALFARPDRPSRLVPVNVTVVRP